MMGSEAGGNGEFEMLMVVVNISSTISDRENIERNNS